MTGPDRAAVDVAVLQLQRRLDAGVLTAGTAANVRTVLDELERLCKTESSLRGLLAHVDKQYDEDTAFMRAEFEAAIAEREAQRNEARAELEQVEQRFAELSNGMTVAVELLDRLTAENPCTDGGDTCRAHGYARKPCPHPLGRQVVEAWRAVQAEAAQDEQDGDPR